MPRIIALLLVCSYFFTAVPVAARGRAGDDASSPGSACDLVSPFRDIHTAVISMAGSAHDAGETALHLHRTSRWIPYKHVEREVTGVEDATKKLLRTIADLSFSLDALPDDDAKQEAMALASTYQNAVEEILDYAHASVDYERTQNTFTSMMRMRMTLTYSMSNTKVRTYWDNITRHHLDERYTEIGDALRSLEVPEHLYARSCTSAGSQSRAATISDPCVISGRLADLRTTIDVMGKDAQDAGRTSLNLHKTTLSRPYKRVENDWIALTAKVNPTLDTLANLTVRFSDTPPGEEKDAALELIKAYQGAVEQFVDYTHFATYYERNENEVATNTYGLMLGNSAGVGSDEVKGLNGLGASGDSSLSTSFGPAKTQPGSFAPQSSSSLKLDGGGVLGMPAGPLGSLDKGKTRAVLAFGLTRDSVKSNMESTALNLFEARYTEADDAFRSLKIPESRFNRACRTQEPVRSVYAGLSPCGAGKDFIDMRAKIVKLGNEVRDMESTARRLHHTPRWRPYKYIENEWIDVKTRSSPLLDELSDLLVAFDAEQATPKEQAATELIGAYQTTLESFIDSGHIAVYYERAENSLGTSFYSDKYKLNFGVTLNHPRNNGNNVARNYLESKFLQTNDAFRSMKLTEYRYGKMCRIALLPLKVRRISKR